METNEKKKGITDERKRDIVDAMERYMAENDIAAADIAKGAKINASYFTAISKGKLATPNQTGETKIPDSVFRKIADYVGYELVKKSWSRVETAESVVIYDKLGDAQEKGLLKAIIGQTGCGKTYTVDHYCERNKHNNVFKVTVGCLHRVGDVLDDIIEVMNIEVKNKSQVMKLRAIRDKVTDIYLKGEFPLLIIDEAENLKLPVFGLIKQLYDITRGAGRTRMCGIVLIGTDQLTDKIGKLTRRNKEGMPQFVRRIKAGIEVLDRRNWWDDKAFAQFVMELGGGDRGIVTLLKGLAENYAEVNDYLETAIINAENDKRTFDIEFFKEEYRLGSYKL